ncbi:hypothetical protein HK411_14280 [Calidifontibacter sp. DB2511S]|uniref:hypothetical protein n=1 Tax=Metallococcus carri TaxID=1656884 RepID=UPI001492698A|nr:hypothetical protein [Metallococcus carri]NOP38717.1 hypothetical protein [Calidifontibacter sp. DB2511S]
MTTYLLDANVLIALTVAEHEHHDADPASLAASYGGRLATLDVALASARPDVVTAV